MSELISKIDKDLLELEERLLAELRRIRKGDAQLVYAEFAASLRLEFELTLDALADSLEHSGDSRNLALRSDRHEQMISRLDVVRNLLTRKIPTAFIEASHVEAKLERQQLESLVMEARRGPSESITSHKTPGEGARNPNQVSASELKQFSGKAEFRDAGLYSASHELAILEKQVRQHHVDGRSIDQVLKDRASFRSRELSKGHVSDRAGDRRIAQTPAEIRRKLADRREAGRGASRFSVRELSRPMPPEHSPRSVEEKPPIAQSPDEIRAKLAARQSSSGTSKASFTAKDIEPAAPQEFRHRRPAKEEEKEKPVPEKPRGKAVFEARDLSEPKP